MYILGWSWPTYGLYKQSRDPSKVSKVFMSFMFTLPNKFCWDGGTTGDPQIDNQSAQAGGMTVIVLGVFCHHNEFNEI